MATDGRGSRRFPAVFARGGTSNGLIVHRDVLPARREDWGAVLAPAMGSPDGYGRQLDGMGSGISSTSKVCVLARSERPDADLDYTFVQVGVHDGKLDLAGNCGNMSSVVGPVAMEEGWIDPPPVSTIAEGGEDHQTATVRIFNTNSGKVIHSRFRITTGHDGRPSFCPSGDYEMDGVPGKASRITLSFLSPAGTKTGKALPTGNPVDDLALPDGSVVPATVIDISNPGVIVRVADLVRLGWLAPISVARLDPAAVETDPQLKAKLEAVRQAGASAMGLDPKTESVPKIVMLFDAADTPPGVDLRCQAMSMGQAHKAVPLTLSLGLVAASQLPGTIAHQVLQADTQAKGKRAGTGADAGVVLGHPSGKLEVGTTIAEDGTITSAELHRTARVLMKGEVFY